MNWPKIIFINFLVLLAIILSAEVVVRMFINFQPDYYSVPKTADLGSVNVHPYGNVPVNSEGSYDQEWESPKIKPRQAYFGDSVAYGVGAGYPFRITEYLDSMDKKIEHINISCGVGCGFYGLELSDKIIQLVKNNEIDGIVYLMNLNDIPPLAFNSNIEASTNEDTPQNLLNILPLINYFDNIFRGSSFLYTYLRMKIRNILTIYFNYGSTGYLAIELEPYKYSLEIELAAINLAKEINILENEGIKFCTLLLPYEMQISEDAAEVYRNMGVVFEDSFLSFETQKYFKTKFKEQSKSDIHILGSSFDEAKVGSFFVYNLGDKIDFNHPNRQGHLILANEIYEKNLCLH